MVFRVSAHRCRVSAICIICLHELLKLFIPSQLFTVLALYTPKMAGKAHLHPLHLLLLPCIHRDGTHKTTRAPHTSVKQTTTQGPCSVPNMHAKSSMYASTLQTNKNSKATRANSPSVNLRCLTVYGGQSSPERSPLRIGIITIRTYFVPQVFSLRQLLQCLLVLDLNVSHSGNEEKGGVV